MPRLVVTGATGRLGRDLVAAARQREISVEIVTREPAAAGAIFGDLPVHGWDALSDIVTADTVVVHLSARNNDAGGTMAHFIADNVTATQDIARIARGRGARRFLFASSIRADDPPEDDFYGRSKRAAEDELRSDNRADRVVVRLPALHRGELGGRLGWLNNLPAPFRPRTMIAALRPELDRMIAANRLIDLALEDEADFGPVRWSDDKDANRWYCRTKRFSDVVFASAVVITLWWLLLAVFVAIKLTSPGPGLFVQQRIGKHGKPFWCYKFRTMRTDTPHAASHLVSRGAVTSIGHFLRRSKLDELPQAVNLLRGEMTLVGPRPCLPEQTELIEAREAHGVLNMIPGITGWAQVNDVDMSDVDRLVRYDDEYRHRRSLLFDAAILLATLRGRGRADRTAS